MPAATVPIFESLRLKSWTSCAGRLGTSGSSSDRIAQTPIADGPAASRNAVRHQKPLAMLRFMSRGILDALGNLVGRRPLLVPLVGEPGTVALLTTPDSRA